MTGNGRGGTSLLRRPGGRLLALLLVGALLLCHVVLGAMHLCSAAPVPAYQNHEHPPSAEKGMAGHEHPPCHVAGAEYFAVLLTALFGLALGLLLGGKRSWDRTFAFRLLERRFRPLVLRLPRGPTAPLTQVFRL